jgi:pimeloyl-ACP methyl ester carboxylesterase
VDGPGGPGQWVSFDGAPVPAVVPDGLWERGVTERVDRIAVLLSTAPFSPTDLTQPSLSTQESVGVTATGAVREFATPGADPATRSAVVHFAVTARRDQPSRAIGAQPVTLTEHCTVQTHPALRARLRLSSYRDAERDSTYPLVPPAFVDDDDASAVFSLTPARGTTALDVIELTDVANADAVTAGEPLVLDLPGHPDLRDPVIVVGRVGDVYLPVGRSTPSGQLVIEQLPELIDTRSAVGAIRLLLRKLARRWLGAPNDTVRLAIPQVVGGEVDYDSNLGRMRERVADAQSVVVLVHGIIGDTRGMVLAGGAAKDGDLGAAWDAFDLVLTADYESLDTTIDQTARQLFDELVGVGVTDAHHVVIVAHSMGGLISRWMIEKLDEPPLVDKLVTLGTPHGGSPWPRVQDMVWTLMTFGLNCVALSAWPAAAFPTLLGWLEGHDQAFDDMKPGSTILTELQAAQDPARPYHCIVGDTSLIDGYTELRMRGMLAALGRRVAKLAFLNQPNDLAVAVLSGENLPSGRAPAPRVTRVASDHVTFFRRQAGLDELRQALSE